jgi:hypothetical protein
MSLAQYDRSLHSAGSAETRRGDRQPPVLGAQITIRLRDKHYVDAIKAEAAIRGMSVSSFMRAMIRGYFGAA